MLAVDDSDNDLELLADALFDRGRGDPSSARAEPTGDDNALGERIELRTASSAESALTLIEQEGPFAVVISDMGMPGMDGAALLRHVAAAAPETVRIMVTGIRDQATAAAAVNDGQVFRFITKPVSPPALRAALTAALRQHTLITAERELLAGTLSGAVRVMVDILAIARPLAFGRAARLRNLAKDVGLRLGYEPLWELELAAMLSQIGYIAVADQTLRKLFSGVSLKPEEIALRFASPGVGADLVATVPRLDAVAEIIRHQEQPSGRIPGSSTASRQQSPFGARVLNVCLHYDLLLQQGQTPPGALRALQQRGQQYDATVLAALSDAVAATSAYAHRVLKLGDLEAGMVVAEDLLTDTGATLMREGEEITAAALARLRGVLRGASAERDVNVLVVRTPEKDVASRQSEGRRVA